MAQVTQQVMEPPVMNQNPVTFFPAPPPAMVQQQQSIPPQQQPAFGTRLDPSNSAYNSSHLNMYTGIVDIGTIVI